jgi:outer membrane murein-binding lipoprotein Lpp
MTGGPREVTEAITALCASMLLLAGCSAEQKELAAQAKVDQGDIDLKLIRDLNQGRQK